MHTIKKNVINEISIKNSRFISCLYKVNNKEAVTNILKEIKSIYKDASHYCYAYIIDDIYKSSDDNEPSGTAGIPILNILKNNDLNFILCIVVRYFGGIKLGAGGLIRSYGKSVIESIKKSTIIELEKGVNITITFNYNEEKTINNIINSNSINSKDYKQQITYNLNINNDTYNIIKSLNIKYTYIKDIYLEKY